MDTHDRDTPPEGGNVYAPPVASLEPGIESVDAAVALRTACIGRESSIKSIGLLAQCLGGFYVVVAITMAPKMLSRKRPSELIAIGVFAAVLLVVGFGLRALQPWARILFTAIGSLFMIGILPQITRSANRTPLGVTVGLMLFLAIVAVFIGVLWFRPSGTIFSANYRHAVIPASPRIGCRTPVWMLILSTIIIALLIVGLFAAVSR